MFKTLIHLNSQKKVIRLESRVHLFLRVDFQLAFKILTSLSSAEQKNFLNPNGWWGVNSALTFFRKNFGFSLVFWGDLEGACRQAQSTPITHSSYIQNPPLLGLINNVPDHAKIHNSIIETRTRSHEHRPCHMRLKNKTLDYRKTF